VPENGLRVSLLFDPPGIVEVPAIEDTRVSIHVGPSGRVSCRRAGQQRRGINVRGDIEIIPAFTPSVWEVMEKDTFLTLSVSSALLGMVAQELDLDPRRIEIRNRFQVRDLQLESIGWALKEEMESGYPCGPLYHDSLAVAVATRLLRCHSSVSREPKKTGCRLSERKFRQVLSYVEDNLGQDISLREAAGVAGLSVSHFKTLFRESAGLPLHQYVIRRRVERAKRLLSEDNLPISQIALETGFSHQSHLAHHMRRVLGVPPRALRDALCGNP